MDEQSARQVTEVLRARAGRAGTWAIMLAVASVVAFAIAAAEHDARSAEELDVIWLLPGIFLSATAVVSGAVMFLVRSAALAVGALGTGPGADSPAPEA